MLYIWHRNYSRSIRVFGVSLISYHPKGLSWPWSHGSWIYNNQCNQCLLPLMLWVRISIRARCTTLCDKVCQWLKQVGGFLRPPVSSTNKTDCHDITEILLNVALTTFKQTNKQTYHPKNLATPCHVPIISKVTFICHVEGFFSHNCCCLACCWFWHRAPNISNTRDLITIFICEGFIVRMVV